MKSNINDELTECYDLLGLTPGASPEELKLAYRDLAKVWHPDRFLHDPRLRAKAQEKLKEINEAYGRFRFRDKPTTQPHDSTSGRHSPAPERSARHAQTGGNRIARLLVLGSVLIFAVVFLVNSRSLERPSEGEYESQIPAIEQLQAPPDPKIQQSEGRANVSANELSSNDRIKAKSQRAESGNASASHPSAAALRPLPTVTIVIDPYTHMIATASCPIKTTMTYPRGNEPHQYCAWHPEPTPTPAGASVPKDSRLKSAAGRLVSPGKWFGGVKSDAKEEDSNSP
jgi:hypothetical protein